jgi:hypothetical protein
MVVIGTAKRKGRERMQDAPAPWETWVKQESIMQAIVCDSSVQAEYCVKPPSRPRNRRRTAILAAIGRLREAELRSDCLAALGVKDDGNFLAAGGAKAVAEDALIDLIFAYCGAGDGETCGIVADGEVWLVTWIVCWQWPGDEPEIQHFPAAIRQV